MDRPRQVLGRRFAPQDLRELQQWIDARAGLSRRRISVELAERWDWRSPNGQLRDMATRLLLNRLEEQGVLRLPARQKSGGRRQIRSGLPGEACPQNPIRQPLDGLRPLGVRLLKAGEPDRARLIHYFQHHHYLGYPHPLGQLHYLVQDRHGRDLAALLFGPAAWKCALRDQFIGWTHPQRQAHLGAVANNSRFLILPWIEVPGLASHLLAIVLRRLPFDWQSHHARPAVLAESFVEIGRLVGTCYRASNWLNLGATRGRSRHGRPGLRVPLKHVYLRPLVPDFRAPLCR
jgi:hypothetical protein